MALILDGQVIVIQRHNYMRTHKLNLKKNSNVQLGKETVDMSAVVGHRFGETFKMMHDADAKGRNSNRMWTLEKSKEAVDFEDLFLNGDEAEKDDVVADKDNRNLVDKNSSQKLSREEIEAMRDSGTSGEKVMAALIENSETFAKKTKFSQAKFLKKKARKYCEFLVIRHPTLRLLVQIAYKSDPMKIMNLRIDSLAQLLCQANVRSSGRYLVYETGCQGLVVAGVLERVGAAAGGKVVHVYQTGNPQTQSLDGMNFGKDVLDNLLTLNMYHLRSLEAGENITQMHNNKPEAAVTADQSGDQVEEAKQVEQPIQVEEPIQAEPQKPAPAPPQKIPFRQKLREESAKSYNLMKSESGGMDGLIVACKQHPTAILLALIKYLAPSRPFAVFSPYKEPVMDAYMAVKESGRAVMCTVSETWLRSHQVLPSRTHPEVLMSGGGGYLLTGTYVDNADVVGGYELATEDHKNGSGGSGGKRKKFRRR
jgi:tRNA (adenine-N(1)-)-methyltransferase non-catalytic subunit